MTWSRDMDQCEGFLAVDKNREGYIGLNEFKTLFDLCNLDQRYVERVFKECDVNDNGKISYTEFAARLVRTDYPQGERSSITSPLTHNRVYNPGRRGKRTGASSLKYVRNVTHLQTELHPERHTRRWDSPVSYPKILAPAVSTLPVLEDNNSILNASEVEEMETKEGEDTVCNTEDDGSSNMETLKISSLEPEKQILPSSNARLEMQVFENGTSKSVSFDINGTNDPTNAALSLCQQQNIKPDAHVSTTVLDALAGKIALARCRDGLIVVRQENEKKHAERIAILEKRLKEATNIVKRLSSALKEKTKAADAGRNEAISKAKATAKRKQTSMKLKAEEAITIAEPCSSPYVKKPAVKIIIDSKGKAEFLNKNREVVDGTSGNLMETGLSKETPQEAHNADDDIEKKKMIEEEESNGGTEGKVGGDVATSTSKEKEIVIEPKADVTDVDKDKSNDSDGKTDGGWKWSDNSNIEDENPVSEVVV